MLKVTNKMYDWTHYSQPSEMAHSEKLWATHTQNRLYLKVVLQRSELQREVSAVTAKACKQRVAGVEPEWHKTMTYLLFRHSRLWIGYIPKMKYKNVTWHVFFPRCLLSLNILCHSKVGHSTRASILEESFWVKQLVLLSP